MCHSTFQTIQTYYQPSDTRVTHQRGEKDTGGNHLTRMCAHSSISESYEWGFRCIETTRRDYKYKFVYTYITFFIIMNCVVETLNKKWRGQGSVDRSRPELLNVISKLDWRNSAMLFIITLMVIYHQRNYIYLSTALVSYEFWNWLNHSCHPCFTYTRSKLCRLYSYFILSQTKEWHDSRTTRFVLPAVRTVRHPRTHARQ